ncbi:hypothetical protein GE09DRAFT_1284396 [Coniochaeta sp. 2T2.1]|nr:hypothetical protein GE09DRAFT_1284396 [Coniochaeta sp. 2T2.1]
MKATTVFATILPMALVATAAPTLEERTGGSCKSNTKQVCCDGLLNCVVQVLGDTCSSGAYCCKTDAPKGALVNIALLNCATLL